MMIIYRLPCFQPAVLPWIILFFAATNVIFLGGIRRAFGCFIAVFHKEYSNITLTELNWVGDSYAAYGCLTSSLSISIIFYFKRRYGLFQFIAAIWIFISSISSSLIPNPHWLFLTHTVLHGTGSSLILAIAGVVVNEHFDKHHQYHILATTLISGGSLASIAFVEIFAFLIKNHGWRNAFVILGIIYFIAFSSGAIFFKKNDAIVGETEQKGFVYQSRKYVSREHAFLLTLWFFERLITSLVTYGILLNLTDYLYRMHSNLVDSTMLTLLFASGEGVTYLLGAIITGVTKDFFKGRLRYVLIIASTLMGTCLILLEYYHSSNKVLYPLCFMAGFGLGPSNTFLFPAGEELTSIPGHIAYPFTLAGMGVGMLISPLVTSRIAEKYNYKWFFFIQGILIFVKVAFLLIITVILHFKQESLDKLMPIMTKNEVGPDEKAEKTETEEKK